MSINLNSVAVLNIHGSDYHCMIVGITKDEAINLLKDTNMAEKSETLQNYKIFFIIYKNGQKIYSVC